MPGRGEGFATPELGGDELLGRQRDLKCREKVSRTAKSQRNGGGGSEVPGYPPLPLYKFKQLKPRVLPTREMGEIRSILGKQWRRK